MREKTSVLVSVFVACVTSGCTGDVSNSRQRAGPPPPGRPSTADASISSRLDARTAAGDGGLTRADAAAEEDASAAPGDAGVRPRDSGPPPVDAGPRSPCPELEPNDPGVWEYIERRELCVYSSQGNRRTFSSAERRCSSLGASFPRASDLDPLCDDILFRRGVTNRGRVVQTSVWVRDTFQSGRLLWSDKGYNSSAERCSRRDYRCGTLQYNSQCQEVEGWSTTGTERSYACLKRVRR